MGTVMAHTRTRPLSHRLACALASACALVALAGPATAHALAGGAVAPTTTSAAAAAAAGAPSNATAAGAASTPLFGAAQPTTGSHTVVRARPTSTGKLSNTAIAAAALAALIALICLAWGVARMLAFEPRWTLSLRHAMAEAGFRASATWAEFSDWVWLGH